MAGISIIIPLYNKKETIKSTIETLISLPDKCNKEIIIIDDGSTDNSVEIAEKFSPEVSISIQKNKGPSAARNHGARLATHPYLVFLDADDKLKPGCLDDHLFMFENFRSVGISFVSFQINDHEEETCRKVDLTSRLKGDGKYKIFSEFDFNFISFIHSGCFCVDKSLFQSIGGYDESLKLLEITDFLTRIFIESPVSVISSHILSEKNEATSESQFQRAAKDSEQIFRFGNKIISLMHHVSLEQKWLLSKELIFTLNKLWMAREYSRVRKILLKYRPLRSKYGLAKPSVKIVVLSHLLSPFR